MRLYEIADFNLIAEINWSNATVAYNDIRINPGSLIMTPPSPQERQIASDRHAKMQKIGSARVNWKQAVSAVGDAVLQVAAGR